MSDWSFDVPPDITVTIRARRKPALLARCLGEEIAPAPDPSLLLDLTTLGEICSGILRSDRYKGITWTCCVDVRPDGSHLLSWRSPLLREYLALHIALLPALRRLLLQRDVALITGAAFESEGAAVVLSGATGSGKTSVLLSALKRGAGLIGDEYIGVSADGDVTPVLRVIALRRAALVGARHVRLHLTRRVMLLAAPLAAAITQRRLDPLVHVSPDELGINVVDGPARLSNAYWLERPPGPPAGSQGMDADGLIDMLSRAQDAHDRAYAVPEPLAISTAEKSRWRDVLASGLAAARCERLTLPEGTLPPDVLRDLLGEGQGALS